MSNFPPDDRAPETRYGGLTIEELRGLEAAATEGPWQNAWHAKVDSTEMIWSLAPGLDDNDVVSCSWYDGPRIAMLQADADFVCAVRASFRFVLAALDAAEAEKKKLKLIIAGEIAYCDQEVQERSQTTSEYGQALCFHYTMTARRLRAALGREGGEAANG